MTFAEYVSEERFLEVWDCPFCGESDLFYAGLYGDDEREVSEAEWLDHKSQIRQKFYLQRRYDTDQPDSIRDYWCRNV